jgi:hypothetical protein
MMGNLVISASSSLGPLSVELIASGGDRLTTSPELLSSARSQMTLERVPPGEYALVATRPSGDRITQRVIVGSRGARVQLEPAGPSPHEFLRTATARGLVSPTMLAMGMINLAPAYPVAGGVGGRALGALLASGIIDRARTPTRPSVDPENQFALSLWRLNDRRWRRLDTTPNWEAKPNHLRVKMPAQERSPRAVGLLNAKGFGPIVMIPPFLKGVSLSFLAEGIAASAAANREQNPSACRVPVAIAVPNDPPLADLLSGLAAPAMPQAAALWEQAVQQGNPHMGAALDRLMRKYEDPAAALLGAHFLARFMPTEAPIAWLRNLMSLTPGWADSPTLLAWRLASGPGDNRSEIRSLFRQAMQSPACLFARTRVLLIQGMRLYGPRSRSRQLETVRPRRPRPGDFLEVAADASGLEAFWGNGPNRPGPRTAHRQPAQSSQVRISEGGFAVI